MEDKNKLLHILKLIKESRSKLMALRSIKREDRIINKCEQEVRSSLDQAALLVQEMIVKNGSVPTEIEDSQSPLSDILSEVVGAKPSQIRKNRSGLKRRILYLDDNPCSREVVGHILSVKGYEVISAESAQEAFSIYKNKKCDLLVIDLELPHFDAGDLIRMLRGGQMNYSSNCPILALVGENQDSSSDPSILNLVDRTLSRPFDVKRLIKCIDEWRYR